MRYGKTTYMLETFYGNSSFRKISFRFDPRLDYKKCSRG